MKYIITEAHLSKIVHNAINKVLLPESKQDDLAKEYLKNHGYEDNDTRLEVRGELLRQVPNLKLDKRKFMLAAVRYFCNGQLSDNSSLASFNKALKLIHDGGHTDEFDYDLNGMNLDDLTTKFRDIAKQSGEEDRMRSANRQFTGKSEYTIIPITSFEEAKRYGRYTSWCVTHGEDAYDSYTKAGEKFYFCLRNGFKNVPENAGQNAPLDKYGLSMISVLVDCEGDLDRVTTRWNHDFGGENHPGLSTTEQLEDLLNVNFYNTFVPYTKDELLKKGVIPLYAVPEMLAQGVPPKKIFSNVYNISEGFTMVELNDKWNYLNTNGELLSDKWFEDCGDFYEGFAGVQLYDKWNYLKTNGEFLSPNLWFDGCWDFNEGLAAVKVGQKCNFINTNGDYLSDTWFDGGDDFNEGFAAVKVGQKWNFINTNGDYLSDTWFDWCGGFNEGFSAIGVDNKYNYINTNGDYLSDTWFDECENFKEGFAVVKAGNKWNFINTNGEFLTPNQWFDNCFNFEEGFAKVQLDNRYNYISTNGELLSPNKWFDRCWNFSEGFAYAHSVDRWYTIDTKGRFYDDNGELINFSLQENRRYRKNKKQIIRITESQLRNAIGNVINGIINLKCDKNHEIF